MATRTRGRLSAAKKEEMVGEAVAMSVRGATYTEISEKLGIARNTAAAWIKGEYAERAEHKDNLKEEAKAHYREIIRAAWQSYSAVDDRSLNKSGHLNAAIRAQERIDKIDGNEAPTQQEHTGKNGGPIEHEVVDARDELRERLSRFATSEPARE